MLDPATNKLPNVYSAVPLDGGWEAGPLQYYKKKFPDGRRAPSGTFVADSPRPARLGGREVRRREGRATSSIYDPSVTVTQTDFTQNVIAMKNAGVKILFIDQMPPNYASAMLKNLAQQNFHPQVILGAATYSQPAGLRTRAAPPT